jgi:hypothetical protein
MVGKWILAVFHSREMDSGGTKRFVREVLPNWAGIGPNK